MVPKVPKVVEVPEKTGEDEGEVGLAGEKRQPEIAATPSIVAPKVDREIIMATWLIKRRRAMNKALEEVDATTLALTRAELSYRLQVAERERCMVQQQRAFAQLREAINLPETPDAAIAIDSDGEIEDTE